MEMSRRKPGSRKVKKMTSVKACKRRKSKKRNLTLERK